MSIIDLAKDTISQNAILCGLLLAELALTSMYSGGQAVFSLAFIIKDRISQKERDTSEIVRLVFYIALFAFCVLFAKWIVSLL